MLVAHYLQPHLIWRTTTYTEGPTGLLDAWGKFGKSKINEKAMDEKVAEKLWELSEKLTGVNYQF